MRPTIYLNGKPVEVVILDELDTIITDIQYDLLRIFCNSEVSTQEVNNYINDNLEDINKKMEENNQQTKEIMDFIKKEKIKLTNRTIDELEKLILDIMDEYSENMDTTSNIIYKSDMCSDLYYVSNVNHIIFNKYIQFYSEELIKAITYQALCTFNNVPIDNKELGKIISSNKEKNYFEAFYYLSRSRGNRLKDFYYIDDKPINVVYNKKLKKPYLKVVLDLVYLVVNDDTTEWEIIPLLNEKDSWIKQKLMEKEELTDKIKNYIKTNNLVLNNMTKEELKDKINKYISKYENKLGSPNKIFIRQGLNWQYGLPCNAYCNDNRNITFDLKSKYYPEDILEHVVYHEMCHLIELNHDEGFYKLMKEEYPDYENYEFAMDAYDYLILTEINGSKS